jgi:hypothetical protein
MKRSLQLLLLILIGILLGMVVLAPAPGDTRWVRTLHNCAHGPIFGGVALLLLMALRARAASALLAPARQYAIAFGAAAALGVLSELAQIPTGRDASLMDAANDVLGIAGFLALFAVIDPRLRAHGLGRRATVLAMAIAMLAILAAPIVRATIKYEQRDRRFPVLADFSQEYNRYFIEQRLTRFEHVRLKDLWAVRPEESAMRVSFLGEPFPGLELIEPLPDWSGYSKLVLDLTNPTERELDLMLRVHDARHTGEYSDRFNKPLRLPAMSRAVIRIPLAEIASSPASRSLDLTRVAGLIVFRQAPSQADEMYLSRLWLE